MNRSVAFLPPLMALLACASPVALAGDGSSSTRGGGNGVVCYDSPQKGQIRSVQLFDYWEQAQRNGYGFPIDLGPPDLSVERKVDIAIERLERLDWARGVRVSAFAHYFLSNLRQELTDDPSDVSTIDDDKPLFLPEPPCYKVQLAVQEPLGGSSGFPYGNPEDLPGWAPDSKLFISKKFFESPNTSNDVRAGLILHEAIYKESLDEDKIDSDEIRPLNYLLATDFFVSPDPNLPAHLSDYLATSSPLPEHIQDPGVVLHPKGLDPVDVDPWTYYSDRGPSSPKLEVVERFPYYIRLPDVSVVVAQGDELFMDFDPPNVSSAFLVGLKWRMPPDADQTEATQTIEALGQRFQVVSNPSALMDLRLTHDLRPVEFTSKNDFYYPVLGRMAHFKGQSGSLVETLTEASDGSEDLTVVLDPSSGRLQQAFLAEPLTVILANGKQVTLRGRLALDSSGNPE